MRLPAKWNGHGADVAEPAQAGDFAAIDRYGEGDVSFGEAHKPLNTWVLYLRWAYFSTRMTAHGLNATVQNLLDYPENRIGPAPPPRGSGA